MNDQLLPVWALSRAALRKSLLFHGTSEEILGDLRGGGYDQICWTAYSPDIAQNYIPEAGLRTRIRVPSSYELKEAPTPGGCAFYSLAVQMGYEAQDIEYDRSNRARSWRWSLKGRPTNAEIIRFVEESLGYPQVDGAYDLKCTLDNGSFVYLPADFKLAGRLYILRGKERLRIFGETVDGDLLDPAYHKLKTFEAIREAGFDAVEISDYAQSRNWGNVGHSSLGLFPSGIAKLSIDYVDAVNFDWGESLVPVETDEFIAYHREAVRRAYEAGHTVPTEVLAEYPEITAAYSSQVAKMRLAA